MEHIQTLPAAAASPSALARMLLSYPRGHLEALTEVLVAALDVQDPDPDLEETGAEDSFMAHPADNVGCPVSDPGGGAVDDEGEPDDDAEGDTSWTEWHTRGRHKGSPGVITANGRPLLEDDEEDDGDTGVEDDPRGFDPESDYGIEDQPELDEGEAGVPADYPEDHTQNPIIPPPSVDRWLTAEHRDYIRQTRCDSFVQYGRRSYRLREGSGANAIGAASEPT